MSKINSVDPGWQDFERMKAGDEKAEIRLRDLCLIAAKSITGAMGINDREFADSVGFDTFDKIFNAKPVHKKGAFISYAFAIARNLTIDKLKKKPNLINITDNLQADESDPLEALINNEELRERLQLMKSVLGCLENLTHAKPKQAKAFVSWFKIRFGVEVSGYKVKEVTKEKKATDSSSNKNLYKKISLNLIAFFDLDLPIGTIKSLVQRARKFLENCAKNYLNG